MIASLVPMQLQSLTQCEVEYLSNIFICGFLNYKGHIVTLPRNAQKLADILTRFPEGIPTISFSLRGKTKKPKGPSGLQEKVCNAFKWLVKYNPLYSSVTKDDSRIRALPEIGPMESQNISVDTA